MFKCKCENGDVWFNTGHVSSIEAMAKVDLTNVDEQPRCMVTMITGKVFVADKSADDFATLVHG